MSSHPRGPSFTRAAREIPASRAKLFARWEARLREDGLAPIGLEIGVVWPEIIAIKRKPIVPEPGRLLAALERFKGGERAVFNADGARALLYDDNQSSGRIRLKYLIRVCEGLCRGLSVHQAAAPAQSDTAYRYLARLYAALAEKEPGDDDDDFTSGDDGSDHDRACQ